LIIEEVQDRFEPVQISVDGSNSPEVDLYERIPGGDIYKLYIGNFESENSENFRLFDKLRSAEPHSELEIHISSDGGNFYELVEFYNLLKPKFSNIVTFLNRGYSAGSMMFLIGDERIVYEHSDFMGHSYSVYSYGKREDMLNQTMHRDKMITDFFNKMYSPYFSKKEIKQINKGKDFWIDSKEMLKRGIANGIILDTGEYKTREEYLNLTLTKKDKNGKKN
jgi:ATP-dependent protease ClpP protease subunit